MRNKDSTVNRNWRPTRHEISAISTQLHITGAVCRMPVICDAALVGGLPAMTNLAC